MMRTMFTAMTIRNLRSRPTARNPPSSSASVRRCGASIRHHRQYNRHELGVCDGVERVDALETIAGAVPTRR